MQWKIRRILLFLLGINLIVSVPPVVPVQAAGTDKVAEIVDRMASRYTYDKYIKDHGKDRDAAGEVVIKAADCLDSTGSYVQVLQDFGGSGHPVLKWNAPPGTVKWQFSVQEEGMYNLNIRYYPTAGKGSEISGALRIDGKFPFDETKSINLKRIWGSKAGIVQDKLGNDIRPKSTEDPAWIDAWVKDSMGYYKEPLKFFLSKGQHTLEFELLQESFVIDSFTFKSKGTEPSYADVSKDFEKKGYRMTSGQLIKVQGEDSWHKTEASLYPLYDRSDPLVEPYSPSKIRLNYIGGRNYRDSNQWISWKINVLEDGLYNIGFKYRQPYNRGLYVSRRIYIDGKVPFSELNNVQFDYSSVWKDKKLGTSNNQPYLLYLSKGEHELKMEVTLGDMAEVLRVIEESVLDLNRIYRRVIMITGVTPDPYRDYGLSELLPDLIPGLKERSKILQDLVSSIEKQTGNMGSAAVTIKRAAELLNELSQEPEDFKIRLTTYSSNVNALSNWIFNLIRQPMDIDYIVVKSPDKEMPRANGNIIERLVNEVKALYFSFFENYSSLSSVSGADSNERQIRVWISTGRDQANIVRRMVDDRFTPQTGINVNLELTQGSLLQATLARKGPDVAMSQPGGEPVNYALRNAVVDLAGFPDFNDIKKRFVPAALVPFQLNGGCYALPETQSFPMMFYRKDIFEELGLKVPQTWDEFIQITPVIQKNNMQVGIPYNTGGDIDSTGIVYPTLVFQSGGRMYNKDLSRTALEDETNIKVFNLWTSIYTKYKFPLEYNFYNRFRTGEMPLGIDNYGLFNQLSIAAPEIRGLWAMVPIPGTKKSDGTIDRSVVGGSSSAILFKNARDKEACWEFIKWWTSAEVQAEFGLEMESLMGPAARYATANVEALGKLPWPKQEYDMLMEQWKWVRQIETVPGSYYLGRELNNAFRAVVLEGMNAREALYDHNRIVNDEIYRKRKEFGFEK